ncbi:hypothetical protein EJ08DRAFT_720211 [Tothia fuscella]|uniref:Uncharacterized protein n=1 Tax=Tothia fuscella TaxID=1048955 RepID=A0A9P4U383_9PEZI|nr:hypothetical protein EJ08DRAFT_720211 [Tothia fuscella]
MRWSRVDGINPKEVINSTRLELGLHSPEHGLLHTTTPVVNKIQSDARGRNCLFQRQGDNNRSLLSISLDMREEDGGSSEPTALEGRRPDEPFIIGLDGFEDIFENKLEDELSPLIKPTKVLQQADNAIEAPSEWPSTAHAEELEDDFDSLFDGSCIGDSNDSGENRDNNNEHDGDNNGTDEPTDLAYEFSGEVEHLGFPVLKGGTDSQRRKHSLPPNLNTSIVKSRDSNIEGSVESSRSIKRKRASYHYCCDSLAASSTSTPEPAQSYQHLRATDYGSDTSDRHDGRARDQNGNRQQSLSSSRADSANAKHTKKQKQKRQHNHGPASDHLYTPSMHNTTSFRHSRSIVEARVSTPAQAAVAPAKSRAPETDRTGCCGSSQGALPKVIEITLRPISARVLFLAATIQATGDSVAFSYSAPETLLCEVPGHTGKAEAVTIKPLPSSGLWIMTGILYNRVDLYDTSGLLGGNEIAPAPTNLTSHCCGLEGRARAVYALAGHAEAGEMERDGERVSDSGFGASDDSDDDDDDSDAGHGRQYQTQRHSSARTRRLWKELDEHRLLAYRRGKKSWGWIFRQFPDRTDGAVRVRVNMLEKA